MRGGTVRSGQGVNVPAERLSLPAITERDREGLARALDLGVDLVAQSFVRGPQDIKELRALMGDRAVPIVAKIETKPAVEDIDKILRVTDVVMVARGDLGVELPMEEIPLLQKDLLRAARVASTPAIVATQMLESMIRAPRPTRAEATDVANAVLDGADGIMLSGETAIGRLPVRGGRGRREDRGGRGITGRGISGGAAGVPARRRGTGGGSRGGRRRGRGSPRGGHHVLHGDRPHGAPPVGGATELSGLRVHPRRGRPPGERLLWGVTPLPARKPADTDEMIALMDEGLQAFGIAAPGDAVVMAAASPAGKTTTNMLKIHRVGSPVR